MQPGAIGAKQNFICTGPLYCLFEQGGKKYRSDGVHFNQLGLTTHAERWFQALAAQYGWKSGSSVKSAIRRE